MSGIFGIFRRDGALVSARDLDRIAAAMRHRTLDGGQSEALGIAGLGYLLTRVTHEDRFEAQPLHDAKADVTLVADLRLDNREDLAAALGIGGDRLAVMPDSALLLCAWQHWGEACVERLLGDFAFAVWDGDAQRLFLARDPMGQRDLFYYFDENIVVFATEMLALRAHPDVPHELDERVIARMLMHDMSGRRERDDFGALPGGRTLTIVRAGAPVSETYWEPHADPAHLGKDEAYYVAAYRKVLGEAVACRLRRLTAPAGLKLSGGYDSSAIAGLAGDVLRGGDIKLVTSSSVMPADYQGTIRHARRWVELCARDMPWIDVRWVTREGIDALTGIDQRLAEQQTTGGSYAFANDALMEALAGAGVRQMMDGHGGDYTLNPRGQAAMARFLKTGQLRRFVRELRAHRRATKRTWRQTLTGDLLTHLIPWALPSYWRRRRAVPWQDQPVQARFAQRMIDEGVVDPTRLRVAPRDRTAMRDRISDVLARVSSGAGASAPPSRHGMTLTRPFHDKRVVELGLAIPEDLYLREGRNRYLACRALADVYPVEFQTRWRKNDDEIPDFQRMVSGIKPQMLEDIARMEQSETLSSMIDFAKIRTLLDARGPDDHNSGWEQETQLALSGYMTARYVEWFRRDNG